MRYKETKFEVKAMNEELTNAYSRIKFLELEVIQANDKMEHVASNKLDEVLAYQKPSSDRSGLEYTRESSSSANMSKEMKFVKAKKPVVTTPLVENVKVEKKTTVVIQKALTKPPNPRVAKPKAKGKSLPKAQRGPQTQHFCHHCRVRRHTSPDCHKLQALKNVGSQRSKGQGKGKENHNQPKGREVDPGIGDVMKMIDTITSCLANFTLRFENRCSSTQSSKDINPNPHSV